MLDHGRPYVLRLANVVERRPRFHGARRSSRPQPSRPPTARWIKEGEVEVPAGQVREIHLTAPAAGRYKLKCTHSFHKMFGMIGHDRRPLEPGQSLDFPLLPVEAARSRSFGTRRSSETVAARLVALNFAA